MLNIIMFITYFVRKTKHIPTSDSLLLFAGIVESCL